MESKPPKKPPAANAGTFGGVKRTMALVIGCFLLVAGTGLVYWPVARFDFVNFDDPTYVTDNPHVNNGLSPKSFGWAWHAVVDANWHPLTLLSHMLDATLFGTWAGGHHLTNVILHTLNSCLLLLLLWQMTGKLGPSFVVAALFAWHPLHVESVAWVSERKDVLSTLFALLCMMAYVWFTRSSLPRRRLIYYWLAFCLFALGLLAKPMVVTVPFILLLLDYWPLQRLKGSSLPLSRIALEKVPFLLLTAVSCGVTLWAQKAGGAVVPFASLSITVRVANATLSYWSYIGKLLWPARLAVYYPFAVHSANVTISLAGVLLLLITIEATRLRKFPWLATGWLWFMGTLVPVIGLVQVGSQGMADRYSYIPSIGFFIAIVFGLNDLLDRLSWRTPVVPVAALAGCAAYAMAAGQQVWYWRGSETLFRHAIAVTDGNYAAYNNLGVTLFREHDYPGALQCYQKAIRYFPTYGDAYANLGNVYRQLKQRKKAITEYQVALKINPKNAEAHYFLGNLLLEDGQTASAEQHYRIAMNLIPSHSDIHYMLASLLMSEGRTDEACQQYRETLRIAPDWIEALNNLAWALATTPEARFRNGQEAIRLASHAVMLTRTNNPGVLDTLGAAYAEAGQYRQAAQTASLALSLFHSPAGTEMAHDIKKRLRLYEKSQPYYETTPPPAVPPVEGPDSK